MDTVTKASRGILAREGEALGDPCLSHDDRQRYFSHAITGADIWLMILK